MCGIEVLEFTRGVDASVDIDRRWAGFPVGILGRSVEKRDLVFYKRGGGLRCLVWIEEKGGCDGFFSFSFGVVLEGGFGKEKLFLGCGFEKRGVERLRWWPPI